MAALVRAPGKVKARTALKGMDIIGKACGIVFS
jgi:hypothetical protein